MTQDRSKYTPDVERILEEYDPATFEERQRKALAKVKEAGLIERLTPDPAARVSAPSPWAKDAKGGLDAGALPSAMGLAEETPVTKPARPAKGRRWPATWLVVLGCVGVMLTAMLAAVLVVTARAKEAADKAAAMMSAAAMVSTVTTAPSAMAVSPSVAAAPSAVTPSSTRPAPSAMTAPMARSATPTRARPHDRPNDPTVEAPEAGAPSAEEAPRPPPTVFVNGPKPEF